MPIIEIPPARLDEYARIPMAFNVRSVYEIHLVDGGLGGIQLREQPVPIYEKDYDSLGGPTSWPSEFDLSNWGIFLALEGDRAIGGAAVAFNTNGVNMLEGRSDLSVLWDIRVHPDFRRSGYGKALFQYAAVWSEARGCSQMKIETQNINVRACRFYASQGCELGDIRRFAYANEPVVAHEVQLNWYLNLR